jgi:ABC-type nitrate/sulfonate/bicarbonate transport system permease component
VAVSEPLVLGYAASRPRRPRAGRLNWPGWAFGIFLLAGIEVVTRATASTDFVPAPTEIARALVDGVREGGLTTATGETLRGYFEGLGIAIAAGALLGVLMGASRVVRSAGRVIVEFLRPIPSIALIPIAIMYFGLGLPMRRFIVAYVAFWPILVTTIAAVRATDALLLDTARTFRVSRLSRLWRVSLPASLPGIATGIRVSSSIALLAAVTAEFVTGGTGGLGGYLHQRQVSHQLPEMYSAIVIAGLLGWSFNGVLRALEAKLVFWSAEARGRRR